MICVCITHTHTYNGILFSLSKEENVNICDIMDKHGGHYTKGNNPDIDRYYMLILMESKTVRLRDARVEQWLPLAEEVRKMEI